MERQLAADIPAPKKMLFLKDNCDKVEQIGYMKQFAPDEILLMKDQLSEVAIEINDLEIKRKDLMDEIKSEVKPLVEQKKTLLKNIKEKAEFVNEECFKFIDHDEKMVGYYNSEGLLVEARTLRPDEFQMIFKMKTGTND